jgi:hypothetical protein
MEKLKTKLKKEWEERPIIVITAGSVAASMLIKLLEVTNETRNSRAWAKEVKRRSKMS